MGVVFFFRAQIVGWPPVKDFRKVRTIAASSSLYVKVRMDGAPYLRKVDLKMYSTYHDLSSALENMFGCLITMGMIECPSHSIPLMFCLFARLEII